MEIPLTQSGQAFTPQPIRPRYSLLLIGLTLIVCFSEGFGYFLRDAYGLPSPHLLGIPVFLMALGVFYVRMPGFRIQRQLNMTLLFLLVAMLWLFIQLVLRDQAYILGYGQTVLFMIMLYLTRTLFEQLAGRPDREKALSYMLGSALVLHYMQIFFIVAIAIVWHATGISFNLLEFFSQPGISENYGFRASGISREPAWAAIGLASTYLLIHHLAPERRTSALCGFVLAAWLINSGTAYLLGIMFGIMYVVERRSSMLFILGGIFAIFAIGLMTYLQWDRIVVVFQGTDPSFNMRMASAGVALNVIYESFPVGAGYGNFRLFGVYGAEFDNFINLELISRYKSDILLLNIFSELGIAGFVFVAFVYRVFAVRGHVVPTVIFLIIMFLYGTIIVPPLLLVVAVFGLLAGRQQQSLMQPAVPARRLEPVRQS